MRHSSGRRRAGGVVSEGQGYGVLLSAAILAGLPTHARRQFVLTLTLELYLGWRRMWRGRRPTRARAARSARAGTSASLRGSSTIDWRRSSAPAGAGHARRRALSGCTPHPAPLAMAPADARLRTVPRHSAPDGDEDAILGIILLVLAVEGDSPRPSWWGAGRWAYASCARS